MRLRTAKDRLKIEHSIIDGLRPVLEELLKSNAEIRSDAIMSSRFSSTLYTSRTLPCAWRSMPERSV